MKDNRSSPPKLFLRFFRWYCHPKMQGYIEGDLMEVYERRLKASGKWKADLRFISDVLLLFRPGIIRNMNRQGNSNQIDMFLNYLKVGIRNILRYKVYSSINVFGLAVGMAASLLIIFYIADEVSYDCFHKDADRIFLVANTGRLQGVDFKGADSSAPIAAALIENAPEVKEAVRMGWWRAMPIRYNDKSFVEKRVFIADSNFFKFFSFPLISGDNESALKGINKVVLTESAARKYFGDENPLGKMILRGEGRYASEVTGVMKDIPSNSHIQFDMLFSGETWEFFKNDHWTNTAVYTYIKLNSSEKAGVVQKKLDVLVEKNTGPELQAIMGLSLAEFKAKGNRFEFYLMPFLDLHLKSDLSSDFIPNGNIKYLYIFGAIAVFVLLIACINFMNLSTARSITRAKEVGVRKSIGAIRSRLVSQFLSESMIYSFSSVLLALIIIGLVIHPFNELTGKNLSIYLFTQPMIILALFGFALIVGVIAGSYPAFYLTAFNPVDVLKGKVGTGMRHSSLRNSLVVFQFIISIALIVGSTVIYHQLKYMQAKDIGFNKENIVVLNNAWSLRNNEEAFKNDLSLQREFKNVSISSGLPPLITDSNIFRKGGSEQDIILHIATVDYDHLNTMGYELSGGRFFSRDFISDSAAIILNEAAYKKMGFSQIEDQTVINFNAPSPAPFKLIGVVKDFNFESLRNEVKPMAMILGIGSNQWMVREAKSEIAIRLQQGDISDAISKLERVWRKHSTSSFEFSFLDQNVDATFQTEQRVNRVVLIFTTLTIVIACLGLFGLATYMGEQRGKEISIHKVLGASVSQVILLLIKDFFLLIGIAFIVGAPIAWYLMNTWLQDFAYRITIEWWMIGIGGLVALAVTLLTIGYQSLKVARGNPVDTLKSE